MSTNVWSRRERLALKIASFVLLHLGGERVYCQVSAGLLKVHHLQVPPQLESRFGYVVPPERVP